LSINRRRLMTAAAAVTASGVLPGVKRAAAAAAPDLFQSPPLTLEVEPGNFCAATARRLVEIALRNELRQEAKLPLLPIAKELRRIKRQEESEEFERFEAVHGKAVWQEALKPIGKRKARNGGRVGRRGCRLSNPGEQGSLGTILRGTPRRFVCLIKGLPFPVRVLPHLRIFSAWSRRRLVVRVPEAKSAR
jgi:hypothetical protein